MQAPIKNHPPNPIHLNSNSSMKNRSGYQYSTQPQINPTGGFIMRLVSSGGSSTFRIRGDTAITRQKLHSEVVNRSYKQILQQRGSWHRSCFDITIPMIVDAILGQSEAARLLSKTKVNEAVDLVMFGMSDVASIKWSTTTKILGSNSQLYNNQLQHNQRTTLYFWERVCFKGGGQREGDRQCEKESLPLPLPSTVPPSPTLVRQ